MLPSASDDNASSALFALPSPVPCSQPCYECFRPDRCHQQQAVTLFAPGKETEALRPSHDGRLMGLREVVDAGGSCDGVGCGCCCCW